MVRTKGFAEKTFTKPSRTKQSFKNDCDINEIMRKFKKVQGSDFLSRYNGVMGGSFGDFSNVLGYQDAIHAVSRANEVFAALPAIVRKRFDNDPAKFLDFVQNPANVGELSSMGLTKSNPVPEKAVSTPAG